MPTRIGFIGAGGIATRHLSNLIQFSDVEITSLADVRTEQAQMQAERFGGRPYGAFEKMLDSEQLDAVYVCVPPFAHGVIEETLVERNLPFFVEKPLATDAIAAESVARGVAAKGLITAVGYHWRYLDTVERARALLKERPPRLVTGYWLDSTPPPGWWVRHEESGGQMVEQTTHIFDLARYLVGEVTEVVAVGSRLDRAAFPTSDIFDSSVAVLVFELGAVGSVASTCLLNWPHRIGLHLFSEGLAIELSEFELMVDVGQGRPVQRAEGDPFVREDRDFVDAIQGKPNRIRAPYEDALKTHLLAVVASRSSRERQLTNVPGPLHV